MNDLKILQELELPLFVLRPQEAALQAFVVFVSESRIEFSNAHQIQLDKILAFLNFNPQEYQLVFNGQKFDKPCSILLCFGKPLHSIIAAHQIVTHSISAMLQNPACKREVLNTIGALKKEK